MTPRTAQGNPPRGRSRDLEDYLLQRATGRVDEPLAAGYPDAVRSRLELGELRFGGSWRGRSTADSTREMQEEAEDLAAYAVLAIQAIGDVADSGLRASVGSLIQVAMTDAARAWTSLETVRCALEEASR